VAREESRLSASAVLLSLKEKLLSLALVLDSQIDRLDQEREQREDERGEGQGEGEVEGEGEEVREVVREVLSSLKLLDKQVRYVNEGLLGNAEVEVEVAGREVELEGREVETGGGEGEVGREGREVEGVVEEEKTSC